MHSIGQVADILGVSTHTLRYYEKVSLLAPIGKDTGGRRIYQTKDIDRVRFIKRAQRMHFSLDEIRQLIHIKPQGSKEKPKAQKLVQEKLAEIEESLTDLMQLRGDLTELLSACVGSAEDQDCPIIEGIQDGER